MVNGRGKQVWLTPGAGAQKHSENGGHARRQTRNAASGALREGSIYGGRIASLIGTRRHTPGGRIAGLAGTRRRRHETRVLARQASVSAAAGQAKLFGLPGKIAVR